MTASRISSGASYQEHWPSILSHNRTTQRQDEASEGDFGQTLRERLSANDEASAPTKPVAAPTNHSANENVASQTAAVSEKTKRLTAPTLVNGEGPKTLALPKDLAEAKTPSQVKSSTANNSISNTGKETRKGPSRSAAESGDPQTDTADPVLSDQQIASVLPDRDDADSETNDGGRTIGEIQESTELDGTDTTGSAGPATGDLAIAMRISSASSDGTQMQGQGDTVQGATAQSIAGLQSQAKVALTAESQQRREPDTPPPSAGITAAQPGTSSQTEKAAQTQEAGSTHASDFEAEFNKFRNEPVRGAHVQIMGAENQRVDIRLQERSGALSVTVRASDSTLATTLQDHAPELSARLSVEHFRTELWTPNSNESSQERAGGGNGGQHQGHGGSGEKHQGQSEKNRQDQEPEWITEFENHPAAFQKRIDYTWHQ